MIKRITVFLVFCFGCLLGCEDPVEFTPEALEEVLITQQEDTTTLKAVLEGYKGKKVLIDVWATWCGDCLEGLPVVKALQQEFPDVAFVFLSQDKTLDAWKVGIEKYQIEGKHYYIKSGSKGALKTFLNSNWIPRYLIVDEEGTISMYKAKTATDTRIKHLLK